MDWGKLSGNFQSDFQYFFRDEAIDSTGEFYPDERFLAAGFTNVVYERGNFRFGIRYENYQNNLLGLPKAYQGEGITYRYAQFVKDGYDITVGNFYEQFGSGLVFRTFEERGLGWDNNVDGIRIKVSLLKGIMLKGIVGRQRYYFTKADGIVRGADAEFSLNELIPSMKESEALITIGGSVLSKYQRANDPIYNLPENVASGAGRINFLYKGFNLSTEFAYKANDPSADNGYIYKPGHGLLLNLSYTQKGMGLYFQAKRIDNMSFRSDRNASLTDLQINYLAPSSKLHTYALPGLYPYATQPNGEMAIQFDAVFQLPRGSFFGGKRGGQISFNYSAINGLAESKIYRYITDPNTGAVTDSTTRGTNGYTSDFFDFNGPVYYRDANVALKYNLSAKSKITFTYIYQIYNKGVIQDGLHDESDIFNIQTGVIEYLYKIKPRHTLRMEAQALFTEGDRGNWAQLLAEYSISPSWFFAIQDAYNYGNPDENKQIHYVIGSMGYTIGTTRFQMNYGRQQQGIFCVGGICRVVPPSNGVTMTITTNF